LLNGCAGLDAAKDAWSGLTEMIAGKDNAEPPKELSEEFVAKSKLSVQWKVDVGDGYGDQNINLVPAVSESVVFAADHEGVIQARKRLTGEKLWDVDAELPFSAGPVLSKDKLILATRDAEVAAYSVADGALQWKASVSSSVLALPAVGSGVVVVRGSDGRLTGLDEKNGATLWIHDRTAPALAVRSKGGPAIAGELVLDGFGGGKLTALRLKTGQPEWETLVALARGRSEVDRLLDVNATPVVKSDMIYVSGYQGGVAAVSLKDGEVQWRQEKQFTHTGLTGNRRSLFMSDALSDVWRLDQRDGGDLWKQKELHQRRLTAPIPIKDKLVVGDYQGFVHVLSQDDGSLTAREEVDDTAIQAAPVVFDDVVYVYTSGGKLAALTVE
jgi:outer membrane protein assembly factor BamB